jgi:hypothetical protein
MAFYLPLLPGVLNLQTQSDVHSPFVEILVFDKANPGLPKLGSIDRKPGVVFEKISAENL